MTRIETVAQARESFCYYLAQHGEAEQAPLQEAVLLHDGCWVGQRFYQGYVVGIWLLKTGELKIQGSTPDASMAFTVNAEQSRAA